jgi:two-component system, OmpR family, alkaline phosphatase synthesis response regulator PhoP
MESGKKDYKQRLVLVVDDEEDIVGLLTFHLEKEGYRVQSAFNGFDALELAFQKPPDLVILDIMLPEIDGLEVCRRLRGNEKTAATPVLMLSARKEEIDKVLGLELGADDYMIKPFGIRELLARVKALIRRLDQNTLPDGIISKEDQVVRYGDLALYPERYQVTVREEPRVLTHKEFELLKLLMLNSGKVMTRELLLEQVWDYEVEVDTRTVDVHIRYLRQKIEDDPANPVFIETVRGVGYRFVRK